MQKGSTERERETMWDITPQPGQEQELERIRAETTHIVQGVPVVLKVVGGFSLIRGGYETTIPLAPISCNNSSFHSPSASLTLILALSGFLLQSLTAHSSGVVWKCSFSHLSLTAYNNITQSIAHTKLCHSSAAIMNSLTNSKLTHRHC